MARRAAEAAAAWAAVPLAERCAYVTEIARLLGARSPDVARRFSLESGKTVAEAETELDRAVETLHWSVAAAARVTAGAALPAKGNLARSVSVDPAGPVLAIVPTNFPAVVLARKAGPALVMGCPVVVKAPETTPAAVTAFAEAAEKAGLPAGVLQTVFTTAEGAGMLVRRPEFRVVSFTGSTRTGRLVAAGAAETLAACVLELGGHAPAIVAADADLDAAVAGLTASKFGTAGQSCAAPSRFLVDGRVLEEFTGRLVAAVPRLDCEHDAAGRAGTMGPLHTPGHRDRVHELVADAVARGARARTGGSLPPGPGFYYPATVLTDVPADARVLAEEPFGPVAPVVGFTGEENALALANSTAYGLGAFLFGEQERMLRLASRVNAGRVSVNCATGADAESPLSGRGDSGHGYEGGDQGLLAFGRLKAVHRPITTG